MLKKNGANARFYGKTSHRFGFFCKKKWWSFLVRKGVGFFGKNWCQLSGALEKNGAGFVWYKKKLQMGGLLVKKNGLGDFLVKLVQMWGVGGKKIGGSLVRTTLHTEDN